MIRNLCRLAGASTLVLVSCCACPGAESFLASMSPPSVVRGATTRVVLRGVELGTPVDLWTSVGGGNIRAKPVAGAKPDEVAFDVTAAADAPLGLHGLRIATDDGLTNPILFVVDDLKPVLVETRNAERGVRNEAKHSGYSAFRTLHSALHLPIALAGTFRPTEIERFAIEVGDGDDVSFECVGSRLGKDCDPLLRIRDAAGKLLFEHDNDPGLFFDFRTSYRFAEAGRYTIELCDERYHGADDWKYLLRIGRFPAARVAVPSVVKASGSTVAKLPELAGTEITLAAAAGAAPGRYFQAVRRKEDQASAWIAATVSPLDPLVESEPNDTVEQATKAKFPAMLCGVFERSNDVDVYEFDLKKGDRLVCRAETSVLDSPADVELAVINADGREMLRVDDVKSTQPGDDSPTAEANATFVANKDGPHRLLVRDVTRSGGPAYAYRVEVLKAGPQLALLADLAELTIPQGDYQSLPLLLTRTEYNGPVSLALVGAPPGVTLEPDVIPEGSTSVWARVRATDAAPLGIGTLRVVATAEVEGEKITATARIQPLIDRQLLNPDLIKYALRENQLRLPPSLADAIALQVTPPSPFTIETPESLVLLVRYLTQRFPIHIVRQPGFTGELAFKAVGGQLGEEEEIRRQIYTRFTSAGPQDATAYGTFFSRNLPQERQERVDLSADGEFAGRRIRLLRSFDLSLKAGYKITAEPKSVTLAPGETATVKLSVERLPPFVGPVTIEPTEMPGLNLPETLTIAAGASSVDLVVKIPADHALSKLTTRLFCKAKVGEFQEEGTPVPVSIEVKKPTPPPAPKPEPKKNEPVKPQAKPPTAKK
jgi:hypothetical protein